MLAIPRELEECARIDGASPLRTVWSVLVSQAWPGLFTAGISAFSACWTEFLITLTSGFRRSVASALTSGAVKG